MANTHEDLQEQIGLWRDTLENLIQAATMPIPDSIHKAALMGSITSMKDEMNVVLAGGQVHG